MASVAAIVLAAGLSSRMGNENKLFLPYKGKPIVQWVIDQVTASTVSEVIVVGSKLSIEGLSEMKNKDVTLVENEYYEKGMTSSIQCGVAQATSDGFMICLGDQPTVSTAIYDQLMRDFRGAVKQNHKMIAVPFFQGKKGNPVIFSKHYRESILQHTEPEGCRSIISENGGNVSRISIDKPAILIDIDTPEDYKRLI